MLTQLLFSHDFHIWQIKQFCVKSLLAANSSCSNYVLNWPYASECQHLGERSSANFSMSCCYEGGIKKNKAKMENVCQVFILATEPWAKEREREGESTVETYSWFSYRYLAIIHGTRNINGVPGEKWELSKCKTFSSLCTLVLKPLSVSIYAKHIIQHIINLYALTYYSGWRHTPTQTHTRRCTTGQLTPANAQVDFEVVPFCKHSDDQEVVEVDAFHQKPVTVGHDTVLHHHHGDATVNSCLKHSRGFFCKC